jgi:geranylgeranyl transferase type-1 subunit beta
LVNSYSALASGSESDLRFVFCAAAISSLINDWSGVDIDRATQYILSCQSQWDNGFGQCPNQEGHGGSTYCGLAALFLMKQDHLLPRRQELIQWLVCVRGCSKSLQVALIDWLVDLWLLGML